MQKVLQNKMQKNKEFENTHPALTRNQILRTPRSSLLWDDRNIVLVHAPQKAHQDVLGVGQRLLPRNMWAHPARVRLVEHAVRDCVVIDKLRHRELPCTSSPAMLETTQNWKKKQKQFSRKKWFKQFNCI